MGMSTNTLPDVDFMKSRLEYDPENGSFTWLEQSETLNPDPRTRKIWNKRYAGKPAGKRSGNGYRSIRLNGTVFYAHRIAWKIITGEEPEIIDHQDGDTLNNSFANLRNTTKSGNNRNYPMFANNTSGHLGVSKTPTGKWRAFIKIHKKQIHLGHFADISDAIEARKAAEIRFQFHPNHGWEKR